MAGTNPMAPYNKLDSTSMPGTTYKTTIDGNSVAALRIVGKFLPHAQTSPNMTVVIDAGYIFDGTTLTEVAAQTTAAFTAPVAHPRIDRIVVDNTTGVIAVVPGAEAVSPVPAAISAGKSPVAQIAFATTTTSISNAIITDERAFSASAGGFGQQDAISSSGTCDLGTITTHNALITGTATITSFGSSASTLQPIYMIEFSGVATLTYDATAMILPGAADIVTAAGDTAIAEYLGSGDWRLRSYSYSRPAAAGGFVKRTVFTSSATFTPQASTVRAYVRGKAAGGAGGGAPTTSSGYASGGGGGEGGKFEGWLTIAQIGSSQSVTIGSAATGATQTSQTQAATGGSTSFGSLMSATGGLGGWSYSTTSPGIPCPGGGGGGSSTGGDITPGGGSIGGVGANGIFGGGGGGEGGAAATGFGSNPANNATSYGGGGGGAAGSGSSAAKAGGNSYAGILIIDEYSS